MSLTSPRLLVPFAALSLAALTIASCGQQSTTPTAPSSETTPIATPAALQPTVTEYFVTLFDPTPAPTRETAAPRDLPLGDDPAPAPVPEPPPASGSGPVPWPPGPPPLAVPGVPMPTPPSTHFRLSMKIDPESVAHSGTPVPVFGCRDLKYTWYYDQHIVAETGVSITFTERQNFFDGRHVSTGTEPIYLAGNRGVVLRTRWCSGYAKPHYTQSRFKGKDEYGEAVEISGPWVRLLTP